MSQCRVLHPGAHTTVQDLGRPGLGAMGVPLSGASDALSLRVGNRLLGNRDSDAAFECALVGPTLGFDADAITCLAGGECRDACIEGVGGVRPLPACTPTAVRAGETVRIGPIRPGARVYLCIGGGARSPVVLGSRSALTGRPLRAGDAVALPSRPPASIVHSDTAPIALWLRTDLSRRTLRVVPGLHTDLFPSDAMRTLTSAEFRVSDRSNRVGLRLEGARVPTLAGSGLLPSEGATVGVVQIPADGAPIILGPDHPTTGGYAALACVIAADLHLLGAMPPRDAIRFAVVTRDQAREAAHANASALDALLPRARVIDLNADVGEALTPEHREAEAAVIRLVSSVNIACGGHAGDESSMRTTLSSAMRAGCAIGAHPSYPDREGFGRRSVAMDADALRRSIHEQIAALGRIAAASGVRLAHAKPHGALYHDVSSDESIARAVFEAARAWDPSMRLVGLAGSRSIAWWRSWGGAVVSEAFADRGYSGPCSLTPRSAAGAMLDPGDAGAQAVSIAVDSSARNAKGSRFRIDAQTICLHSDAPNAAQAARAVRDAFTRAGLRVAPL
ncbi:MAG: 5-oxoprolinase subunit PxpA [Phycisphaeraceae bacterium]|nr:5-oxoprolinase subunit PxpA [Phycisphaeraceae bacterium]